jgi:hypothetical protein
MEFLVIPDFLVHHLEPAKWQYLNHSVTLVHQDPLVQQEFLVHLVILDQQVPLAKMANLEIKEIQEFKDPKVPTDQMEA